MRSVTDALGRDVTYSYPPERIIALDPAITETLYHFGLDEKIVGRTRFCIYPKEKVKNAVNVGGTKEIKMERIHGLKPDLIIAEKEENTKEMVEELEKHYPIYVCEIQTVEDGIHLIEELGDLFGCTHEAKALHAKVETAFNTLPQISPVRVAYMIWKRPYMAVGRDTYINHTLEKMGFINPFAESGDRYPVVTEQDLKDAKLDYIFLSSEPYPFRDKNHAEFLSFLPEVTPVNIDGQMFWYGVRMLKATEYFKRFLEQLPEKE